VGTGKGKGKEQLQFFPTKQQVFVPHVAPDQMFVLWVQSVGFTPENRYAYYKCKGTDRGVYADGKARCSGVVRAELVDTAVWQALSETLKHPEKITEVLRSNQAEFERRESPLRVSLDSTTALLAEAKQERATMVNAFKKGLITEDEFAHDGKETLERIAALTAQEQRLQSQLSKHTIPDHLIEDIAAVCGQIRDGIEYFTFDDKRHVLELLNIQVVVQRGNTRRDDILILTGYIPTTTIPCVKPRINSATYLKGLSGSDVRF
jgi:hypothetical protein